MTTARIRICDAAWDESVGALLKKALFLAGDDSKAAPCAQLFGTAKAKDLRRLGPAKATVAAGMLLTKMETLGNPELSAPEQDLAAKTEALRSAEQADAELKIASHGIERTRMLRQVETLIAETEAKILTLHPGRDDLVRAILNPNQDRSRARRSEPTETPAPQDL
jgi:hypothetical protein